MRGFIKLTSEADEPIFVRIDAIHMILIDDGNTNLKVDWGYVVVNESVPEVMEKISLAGGEK